MAILKTKQIHEMSDNDLLKKLNDINLEIMKEKAQIAVGGSPTNPGKIKEIKKTIARILTEINKRKKGGVKTG